MAFNIILGTNMNYGEDDLIIPKACYLEVVDVQ